MENWTKGRQTNWKDIVHFNYTFKKKKKKNIQQILFLLDAAGSSHKFVLNTFLICNTHHTRSDRRRAQAAVRAPGVYLLGFVYSRPLLRSYWPLGCYRSNLSQWASDDHTQIWSDHLQIAVCTICLYRCDWRNKFDFPAAWTKPPSFLSGRHSSNCCCFSV